MTVPFYLFKAFEKIDAAMFSGDAFLSPENRAELRKYMARWERELPKQEALEKEIAEDCAVSENQRRDILKNINDFEEALEKIGAQIGIEEGRVYFTDEDGDELTTVGQFTIAQTNSGPDVFSSPRGLGVKAFTSKGAVVVALYVDGKWVKYE